jgi:hypothetical protein
MLWIQNGLLPRTDKFTLFPREKTAA